MPEIAVLLKNKLPEVAEKVSTKKLPDWIVNFAALFNKQARQGAMFLRMNRRVSNAKAKNILGWAPITTQENTILAAVESMVKFGLIK